MNHRFSSRALSVFLVAGAGLAGSCSPDVKNIPDSQILIVVNVKGVLTNTKTLQVKSSLNGKPDPNGINITNNTTKFAIQLAHEPKNYGQLRLDGFALDTNECYLANGQVTEQIVEEKTYYELDLTLTPSASPKCSFSVKILSSGQETVTSNPIGISCGGGQTTCSYDFPFGTAVTLTGSTGHKTYPVWTSGCTPPNTYYTPTCTATLQKGNTTATVDFVGRNCTPDNLCLYQPQLTSGTLVDVWGSDAKNVWTGGSYALAFQSTGGSFAVNPVTPFNGASVSALRGTGATNMYALANSSAAGLVKWDGSKWNAQIDWPNKNNSGANGLWVAGPSDVFVTVYDYNQSKPFVYRFNGSSYTSMGPTPGSGENFYRMWGVGGNPVFMGSSQGIWRYDGTSWTKDTGPTVGKSLSQVWGTAPNDVWAASSNELYHFDGTSWTLATVDNGVTVSSIQGLGGGKGPEVYMPSSAANGRILRYAGGNCSPKCWTSTDVPNVGTYFRAIWGPANDDLWAVGNNGVIFHYDGTTWTRSPYSKPNVTTGTLYGAYGTTGAQGPTAMFFGPADTLLNVDDGNLTTGTNYVTAPQYVYAAYGAASNDIVVVGGNGLMLRYNGTTWQNINTGTTNTLYGVYISTSGTKYYYVVGSGGWIARTDSNFSGWTQGSKNVAWSNTFRAIGGSGTSIVATSYSGIFYRTTDGLNWTQTPTGNSESYYAAFYHPYFGHLIGGSNGSLLRVSASSGTIFQTYPTGTTAVIYSLWGPSNAGHLWIGGSGGTLIKYDGTLFTPIKTGTTFSIYSIWGSSQTDVWAAGDYGMILRWKQ